VSTRSDVGFTIKNEAFETLPESVKAFLTGGYFETTMADEEGRLFHSESCKWNPYEPPISDLYAALKDVDEEDFRLLEGCHDYPGSDEGNCGVWEDPWEMSVNVSVSVNFYTTPSTRVA
jgi:hypothetical protein